MRHCATRRRAMLAVWVASLAWGAAAAGDDYPRVAPLDGHRQLRILGVSGELSIRPGPPGALRYRVTDPESGRRKRLRRRVEAGALVLGPTRRGASRHHVRLEIAAPPGLAIEIEAEDCRVDLAELQDDVTLRGARIDLRARDHRAAVRLELDGGALELDRIAGPLHVSATALRRAVLRGVGGELDLELHDAELELSGVDAPVHASLHDTRAVLRGVQAELRLSATDSTLKLEELSRGGELRLSRSPLTLTRAAGDLTIETDSAVRFDGCTAELHIDNFGGEIVGTKHVGLLEIKGDGARVRIETLEGPLRIEGTALELELEQITGETLLYLGSSKLVARRLRGPLTVENDRGDVAVRGSSGRVEVYSRDGEVRLTDLRSAVEVSADGPSVLVAWTSIDRARDSRIRNTGGDVEVRVPGDAGCRIEARSAIGRVETRHAGIRLLDGGSRAEGAIGEPPRSTLQLEARGQVRIDAGTQ